MSSISRDEVARVAGLARIDLTPAELDRLAGELDVIVQSVARVSEVATADVPATSHPLPMINVFREGWLESQTACWTYYVGDSRGGFLL